MPTTDNSARPMAGWAYRRPEGSAGGAGGESGCLDRVIVVAETAQVAGQSVPPGGCAADAPVRDGGGGEAAGVQVAGRPAAGDLPGVEGMGVGEDLADGAVCLRR